nr:hypothetical protein [Brachyspira sp. G79]
MSHFESDNAVAILGNCAFLILEKHIGFFGIYLSMALSPIVPAFIGIIYFLIFIKKHRLYLFKD